MLRYLVLKISTLHYKSQFIEGAPTNKLVFDRPKRGHQDWIRIQHKLRFKLFKALLGNGMSYLSESFFASSRGNLATYVLPFQRPKAPEKVFKR